MLQIKKRCLHNADILDRDIINDDKFFFCMVTVTKRKNLFCLEWKEEHMQEVSAAKWFTSCGFGCKFDEHLISPHNTTPESNIKVTGIKERISN